jgi:cation transport regulator
MPKEKDPVQKLSDLAKPLRKYLPKHAQEIFMKAYNNAWHQYKEAKTRFGTRTETAHRVAWAAVKKEYKKDEETGKWVKK